ncbi:MAG: AAA family ATPase, partial [Verrucomicrobiae bacterium]|nr:AAA family ATPase [Verrucomicrobiae bacterium]
MIGEIVSNQYRLLEVASEDLVSTEYRAHDQREGRDVTLKLLHEQVCSRSTEGLYRYRRLIRDLEGLKHPSICPVYAHGEWNKRDYVVLAPPHGDALGKIDVREIDVSLAVHAILSAARGLEAAHRLGILHGSLNPESMLLHKNGDTAAELRNFGAGLLLDLTRVRGKDDVRRVFGYLAPEQSGILRKPTDGRSDIYSLGILFYQLLTGVPPYQSDDAHNLISEHISREPARPRERNPRIPDVLERIVLKLIAKDPDDRYQTLPGFIADLEQFEELARTGGSLDFEIGRNDRLRELNFATRMIGREAELGLLRKGVAAAKEGRGTLLFIRGEPGIGKTRLINELRVDVHQAGGLFVGGKCHQYESGTPFRALSGALEAYVERLRRLSPTQRSARVEELKNGVGDLGGEVLKLTPRLSELIGTPPPLPELEPEKERVRFLITAANFLAELGSRELPVVVFLEDLQWSDEGTIELLERLARKIEDKPLLVLASYRSNEVGPEHSLSRLKATLAADAVPFEDVEVKAFGLAETEQMIGRILLEKPERIRSLAQFLHARSRGNPFFIVELLRTVIDGGAVRYEDGRVEYDPARLEQVDLPENIVEAVLRRIEDVPAEDMQILSFAAVMGKHVDLGLLGQLSGRPLEEILGSVENGIRHQILTRDPVADGTVLFVHDRVREAFYRRVNDRDAALLHLKIAETLEAAPAADASVYDLAYHFSRAGVTDKALRYSLLAAQTAAQASANALAIELYEQSRKLLEAAGHPESKPEYALVLEQMGELRRILGQYDAALEALQACVPLLPPGDTLRLAQVLSRMADSHFEKGEPERTIELIERALRSLGVRLPRSKFGIYAGILRQLAIHFAHMTRPAWYNRRLPAFDATDEIKVRLTSRLFYVHIFFNPEYAFFLHLLNVNFCENLAPSKLLASQYAASGPVWLSLPWYWKTMRDLNLGLNLARQSGDRLN